MIQQTSKPITFEVFFTAAKVGKVGLTPTVDVYNPSGTLIVTSGAASETGGGFYRYTLAGASTGASGAYRAIFKTADATVDLQHVPSLWEVGVAGVDNLNNLDALVSSRLATSGYTSPRVLQDLIGEVGQVAESTADLIMRRVLPSQAHLYFLSESVQNATLLAQGKIIIDPRYLNGGDSISFVTAGGSALVKGVIRTIINFELIVLGDEIYVLTLDSPFTGPISDWQSIPLLITPPSPLLSRLTPARAAKLDNLDVSVSSRLASSDYVAGGSGGSSVRIVQGPLILFADSAGSDGVVEVTTGDSVTLALYLRDGNNEPIPYTSGTLSARLVDGFGTIVTPNVPLIAVNPDYGIASAHFTFAERGRFRLFVKRTGSVSDIATFGPLTIHVCGAPVPSPPSPPAAPGSGIIF